MRHVVHFPKHTVIFPEQFPGDNYFVSGYWRFAREIGEGLGFPVLSGIVHEIGVATSTRASTPNITVLAREEGGTIALVLPAEYVAQHCTLAEMNRLRNFGSPLTATLGWPKGMPYGHQAFEALSISTRKLLRMSDRIVTSMGAIGDRHWRGYLPLIELLDLPTPFDKNVVPRIAAEWDTLVSALIPDQQRGVLVRKVLEKHVATS